MQVKFVRGFFMLYRAEIFAGSGYDYISCYTMDDDDMRYMDIVLTTKLRPHKMANQNFDVRQMYQVLE